MVVITGLLKSTILLIIYLSFYSWRRTSASAYSGQCRSVHHFRRRDRVLDRFVALCRCSWRIRYHGWSLPQLRLWDDKVRYCGSEGTTHILFIKTYIHVPSSIDLVQLNFGYVQRVPPRAEKHINDTSCYRLSNELNRNCSSESSAWIIEICYKIGVYIVTRHPALRTTCPLTATLDRHTLSHGCYTCDIPVINTNLTRCRGIQPHVWRLNHIQISDL